MKKVLIFSIAYYPLIGGAEVAVKEITDRISDFQFDMITAHLDKKTKKEEKIGNINVYRISGSKFLFPIHAYLKARKLHKKNNYDLIWSIMAAYAGFAGLFFKSKNNKIPFLLTLQEGDSEKHILKRIGIFYPLWRKIFQRADYIQTISNYLADFAKKYGAKCPIEVVPNGVNIEKFTVHEDKVLVRKKIIEENSFSKSCISEFCFDIAIEDKILITTSRLVKKNAVDDIIKSLQFLPDIKFIIIGDGAEMENLKKLARELKLEKRITFLGQLEHDNIVQYLAMSDIFIRPSLSEGMGNSFIEAMAAEIPVIATNVGGIPDFLKDYETGLFCKANNPQSIADKVKLLLEDENLKNRIIANAKQMVEKNYDWNLIILKMKNIFDKLFSIV